MHKATQQHTETDPCDEPISVPMRLEAEIRALAEATPCPATPDKDEAEALKTHIKALLESQNAVLVTHYYVDETLQQLAEETGGCVADSLEMANFGNRHKAQTLVVVGVRFMGETAKILNPEKRVLMPALEAECSLDLSCPAEAFRAYCDAHPDHTVVVYANTAAAVKARADWMVTSSNAIAIVKHLKARDEKIIWAPDRHLGAYVAEQTGASMHIWQGMCVVHDEFRATELKKLMAEHPEAQVLVHPESPREVIQLADTVGSTTTLINAARSAKTDTLIIATDYGLFHKIKQAAPDKNLLIAPTGGVTATCSMCAHCPWMGMNTLANLAHCLEQGSGEIHIEEHIRKMALRPIERMLAFSREQGITKTGG